ncbi:MAG: DEAD/DEAH box helicase, partial [Candidatus Aenigmarchaeota archaeon]|nr:DEAD/DEAH box helicase [Candidatus Aenigmarchaeota archaeon]
MRYVEHSWINPNIIEYRTYQDDIIKSVHSNTLCVLPTGLGKTNIAVLVAVNRMEKVGGKVLFLAPTRPLVSQHMRTFEKALKLGVEMREVTGETDQENRMELYKKGEIIFSTPQTVRNDLKSGLLDLKDFCLCIF